MESEEEAEMPPGKARYTRIKEKILHLTKYNLKQEAKEILEILDKGEILYPTQGRSIMQQLVGKTDDLYLEPCFPELVKTIHSSHKESEEDIDKMVWRQLRYGAPNMSDGIYTKFISTESTAEEVIAKLKIFIPLDAELCTRILWKYSYHCVREKEWNSYFVDLLTFLIREGGDPLYLMGPENGLSLIAAFTLFLGKLSYLSESLVDSVSTFLQIAFKKWEESISKKSILSDVIKSLPSDIIEGVNSGFSSVKGLIVVNCLKLIETYPVLSDHVDRERKTPLHRLLDRILLDGLWQQIPELVSGNDKIWDLVLRMTTNNNVNIMDRGNVTPYTWILWWQNSVTDTQVLDVQDKQKLSLKIEEIKKHFLEKGASEEDALQGMKHLKTTSRYRKIEENIESLNALNIEQHTKEILEIVEEGEIIYPTKGSSIMKKLVGKTDDLYMQPSFAQLVKTLYCSYEASALAREEDLTVIVWRQLRHGSTDWSEREDTIWISTDTIVAEVIAKLGIYTPLEAMLSTRFLQQFIQGCDEKDNNVHFVEVLTFLILEGADPFKPAGEITPFTSFIENFGEELDDILMPSVTTLTFLEEVFKKMEVSKTDESIVNELIKFLPSKSPQGDSINSSDIIELIARNCQRMTMIKPALCDHVDSEGKTPLQNLMKKLVIADFVAGADSLWNLMSPLITEKTVNIRDKDQVTPFSWFLLWQESMMSHDVPDKHDLSGVMERIKKHFLENGAQEEDTAPVVNILRYRRIEEKIQHLTTSNVEQQTKDVLEILEKGEITWPIEASSIFWKLLDKTDDLYKESSFAMLLKELHSSFQRSTLSVLTFTLNSPNNFPIENESTAEEFIAKLKIFLSTDDGFCTRHLYALLTYCDKIDINVHFMDVMTFLIKEDGSNPFQPIEGTDSFTLFLERLGQLLEESSDSGSESDSNESVTSPTLILSVTTFLEEVFKKWEVSKTEDGIVNKLIKFVPSKSPQGDSSNSSAIIELIARNCQRLIKIEPALCDHVDSEGKTPLQNLMKKLVIADFVAGADSLWNLMSPLITEKTVNIRDKDQVTPLSWFLLWQESMMSHDVPDKQNLSGVMERIKKHFLEKGAQEGDTAHAVNILRYRRIEEKIKHLTTSNLEQHTKDVLEILEKGEITWPKEAPSIIEKLIEKTDDLYTESSFAMLVKVCYVIIKNTLDKIQYGISVSSKSSKTL